MRILTVIGLALALPLQLPATAPVFDDGLAQPVFAGQRIIKHNVWVEVPDLDTDRDGVNDRIRVQISRPEATERGTRLPVILMVSPYSGGTRPYPQYDIDVPLFVPGASSPPMPPGPPPAIISRPYVGSEPPIREINSGGYAAYFLQRGFIHADANSLGTGHSTGCPTIGGREENLAIKAVIDWFNGQGRATDADGATVTAVWTTGATGMIGTSYVGTLPIGVASLGVDGLKAIVPIAGVSSYYDHRRSYGAVINSYPMTGTDPDTLFDNILTRKHPEACAWMRARMVHGADRRTGDYNAYWDERNYVKDAARFKAAVLISHGLNDFNVKPRHAAQLWTALRSHDVPAMIWWHQGGHGDRPNARRQAEWRETLNRFWTAHLHGVNNGVMDGPAAVVERENNEWVEYADWPVPGARPIEVRFAPDTPNGIGRLGVDLSDSAATELIVDDALIDANVLVAAPASPNRLVYRTPPLAAPVHVSGTSSVTLRLAFDGPAANVGAMLVDYRASAEPFIVTRSWADPQNRESISRTTPVVPGTVYTMTCDLQPHDYIFPAGSRLGLVVVSSDRLFTLRPPPGTRLTFHPHDSLLRMPVVGGDPAFASAIGGGRLK